jgi:hypothetical protein
MNTFKHTWLKLYSHRTQPYTLEDISVIVPSTKGRFEKRMQWFWPQYIEKTDPGVVSRTYVPCDPGEDVPGIKVEVTPRWIVCKTLGALEHITTRLTFRLANDIMIVRKGWEQILLDQFNDQKNLQVIGELQNGITFPQTHIALAKDWEFFRKEYSQTTSAAEYMHGARLFAQTSIWRGYYSLVQRYTQHDHDEIFFTQLARGDGVVFTNFQGINLYLAHCGITNQDFSDEYINGHIAGRRQQLEKAEDKHKFVIVRP